MENSQPKLVALTLPLEDANTLLRYIGTKPYYEVKELVELLQHLQPVYEKPIEDITNNTPNN